MYRAGSLAPDVASAVVAARADVGPSVIVVAVEPHRLMSSTECFWDVGIFQTSGSEQMRELAAEHTEGQLRQRQYASHRPPST